MAERTRAMIKVAARTLDFYDDVDGVVARTLPAELHELKVAGVDEVHALPDRCFGLVMKTASGVRRRWPVHTEDALKLSKAYFERARDGLPPEAVKAASAKFAAVEEWFAADEEARDGLRDAYNGVAYVDLAAAEPPREKVAYADRCWGLVVNGRNCFPLHDADLVKQAMARFPFTRDGLAPEQAFVYARNIEKRAQALGVEVPPDAPINLYTAPELNLTALAVAIDQRKEAAAAAGVDDEVLDQLAVLAGCPLEQGGAEREMSFVYRQAKQAEVAGRIDAERIVGVLRTFDKLAGIGKRDYMRGMLDPFAACYKQAAYPSTGAMVDGVDLSVVDAAELARRFDEGFVADFQENPVAVYKSLPDPVKSVIRSMAESAMGQPPTRQPRTGGAPASAGASGDPIDRLNPTFANGNVISD